MAILVLNILRPHQNGPYQLLSILKHATIKAKCKFGPEMAKVADYVN